MTQKTKLVPVITCGASLAAAGKTRRGCSRPRVHRLHYLRRPEGGRQLNITIGRTEIAIPSALTARARRPSSTCSRRSITHARHHPLNGKDIQLLTLRIDQPGAGIAPYLPEHPPVPEPFSVEENIITAMDTRMHYNMAEGISACRASGARSAWSTSAMELLSPSSKMRSSPTPRPEVCPTARSAV